jgi:hypothetical protein
MEGDVEEGTALVKKPTVLSRTSTVMTLEKESCTGNKTVTALCRAKLWIFGKLLPFLFAHEYILWSTAFSLVASSIWISVIVYDLDRQGTTTRANQPDVVTDLDLLWLRSLAVAPLGAWFRWALTRIKWIKSAWPEMNPQTMTANLVAVALACLLAVLCPSWTWYLPIVYGTAWSHKFCLTGLCSNECCYLVRGMWFVQYGIHMDC